MSQVAIQVGDGFNVEVKPTMSFLDRINARRMSLLREQIAQQLIGRRGPTFFDSDIIYAPHVPKLLRDLATSV